MLIKECTRAGQTLADDVVPRQGTCIQVSRDRWLIVYQTHGFRGVDDEWSIVYQLRRGAPDGTVIKEGFLAREQADWDPLGDGGRSAGQRKCYFKQHGHSVAFIVGSDSCSFSDCASWAAPRGPPRNRTPQPVSPRHRRL